MHIAIDDTYGPGIDTKSSFVTGGRRTHVAVVFPDEEVQDIRKQMVECLGEIFELTGVKIQEFHFVDIYNRKSPWDSLPKNANLGLFEFFASIYKKYHWPVLIKTIDDRTLRDHNLKAFGGKIDGLEISKREDLSLLWLLINIKNKFRNNPTPITLFLDEGRKKPGTAFGSAIFHDWPASFRGSYTSSSTEPLLQIADFLAFCINRSTHLSMKINRSDVDIWFLNLVGEMKIDCEDLKVHKLKKDFSVSDFDELHLQDRTAKGLLKP